MKKRRQSGFTLIELALVMGVSVLVASIGLMALVKVNIQTVNQASKFKFLAQDAPTIGLLLTRTIGNAEDYRIYSSRAAAASDTGAANYTGRVLSGPAVRLWMAQPNGTSSLQDSAKSFRHAILSFETINGHQGIYFFLADPQTGVFPAAPNWELAGGQLTNATFDANSGVLLVTLNGSNNDWYQFAAEKK
jgi:prepilin-type N-terminal cleavage/methylation domain-containing protein